MLTILQKNNIANTLIIVTRYFGGILLGTGGLVRSYSASVQKALEKSEKIQKIEGIVIQVSMNYSEYSKFQHYCNDNNILITNVEYSELIVCKIELEEVKKEKLKQDFEAKNIILEDIKEIDKKYIVKSI